MSYEPNVVREEAAAAKTSLSASAAPRLRRSRDNRVIAGVAGALGEYLGIDPLLLRVAFVALVFAGGVGVLLYLVCWIVIPAEKAGETASSQPANGTLARTLVGIGLMVVGATLLLQVIVPWIDERVFWALTLIAIGGAVLLLGSRRGSALSG
jgi:phage shock protein C